LGIELQHDRAVSRLDACPDLIKPIARVRQIGLMTLQAINRAIGLLNQQGLLNPEAPWPIRPTSRSPKYDQCQDWPESTPKMFHRIIYE
jgi:hypothetical protein